MVYNLEIGKIIDRVKEINAKRVLIQLPDGLKNISHELVDEIERNTGSEVFIWFGSCFGACDLPLGLEALKIDLTVQFGHNRFWKEEW